MDHFKGRLPAACRQLPAACQRSPAACLPPPTGCPDCLRCCTYRAPNGLSRHHNLLVGLRDPHRDRCLRGHCRVKFAPQGQVRQDFTTSSLIFRDWNHSRCCLKIMILLWWLGAGSTELVCAFDHCAVLNSAHFYWGPPKKDYEHK